MKCPTCQATIKPFYKVLLLTRWPTLKCDQCGNYAKRKIDGQFLLVLSGIIFVGLVTLWIFERFIPSWSLSTKYWVAVILWLPIMTYIDAKTVKLRRKDE